MVYSTHSSTKINSFFNAKKYKNFRFSYWRNICCFVTRFYHGEKIYNKYSMQAYMRIAQKVTPHAEKNVALLSDQPSK